MTPITYLNGSSNETEAVRLCLIMYALPATCATATNPNVRFRYFHLAKLWREMADDAVRRTDGYSPSEGRGVVLFLNRFQKSK